MPGVFIPEELLETMFADVILPLSLPNLFTYRVPEEMEPFIRVGARVAVQFGRKRKYSALVRRLHSKEPDLYEAKSILFVIDETPILYEKQLELWDWIAEYYMAAVGDVMNAALPSYLKLGSETVLVYNEAFGEDFSGFSDAEYLVAEALSIRNELSFTEIQKLLGKQNIFPEIRSLLDLKVCFLYEELKENYRPKVERYVQLLPEYEDESRLSGLFDTLKRAPKQTELLLAYIQLLHEGPEVSVQQLLKKASATHDLLNRLVERRVFAITSKQVDRVSQGLTTDEDPAVLSEEQKLALRQIRDGFAHGKTVLLHGVTSSGKTVLYFDLIDACLKSGKQTLYLLPEIALTAQLIKRLQRRFGDQVGIYHSKFSDSERVEIWNKVKEGTYSVLVGARSALMLPFHDLGLIILDEEHDSSYKQQDPAPRYHARDAAIYYGQLFGAHVLLGSATPSLESYYNAQSGKFSLVSLKNRYGGIHMPEIVVADLKEDRFKKLSKGNISSVLYDSLTSALDSGQQAILFQNRRGYAPLLQCQTCGWIAKCNNCDVSLTYHKYHNKLHCHYCGALYPLPLQCNACGSQQLLQKSFGTERIEAELEVLFPKARIARMDMDSVRTKHAHQKLVDMFESRQYDILVGTQMVAKGLDFENLNLVGILSADQLLSYPDFRVHERAFQLMEQVSGRAGRRAARGRVIIQAVNAAHPLIQHVARHDYISFYEQELAERKRFMYPPFSRLLKLTFKHRKRDTVQLFADEFIEYLKAFRQIDIIGPAEPPVSRIRNQYIQEALIKLPKGTEEIRRIQHAVWAAYGRVSQKKDFKSVLFIPDMDVY